MYYTQRMEDLRKDKDMTQAEVAEKIGMKCEFYNVSADYLLGFTNQKKSLPKK